MSSWLLRVAAANFVSLSELLAGLEYRYGRVLTNVPIDYSLPDAAVTALSQFCRLAAKKIRLLDLRQQRMARRDVDLPPLLPALQENLGLKLEKRKGPVEMLAVDHIEKTPTENRTSVRCARRGMKPARPRRQNVKAFGERRIEID